MRSSTKSPRLPRWIRYAGGLAVGASIALLITLAIVFFDPQAARLARQERLDHPKMVYPNITEELAKGFYQPDPGGFHAWWDPIPSYILEVSEVSGQKSNIHPADYIGPDSCRECHPQNHASWLKHSHSRMNALANSTTVVGDFSGSATIDYLGGEGKFYRENGGYYMRLSRGDTERVYRISQTIGSRFFQYYVGKLERGPESRKHVFYSHDHILPFGYWIEPQQWVPVVHVEEERSEGQRIDPFGSELRFSNYASSCNICHTTFPLGDMFVRAPHVVGRHAPRNMHWSDSGYLAAHRPEVWSGERETIDVDEEELASILNVVQDFIASEKGVTLGISCEACHLGAREHALDKKQLPKFFPSSPHLLVEGGIDEVDFGREHDNLNWACGRCHAGDRPHYANGVSTWNSTEYSDAARGSCYSELTCVTCHDPHKTIGQKWTHTAAEDDAKCLKCHSQFEPDEQRAEHTHHPADSAGSSCMNCHMPRINEGLQDMVRTHTIFSPTRKDMIEANHPNACNICHTDKPIDWTTSHLAQWYGSSFDEQRISQAYPQRDLAVGLGWLKSDSESVRLLGADALARSDGRQAAKLLIDALEDPYLINRQFAMRSLERILDVKLSDFGYRFYMTPDAAREPLRRMREKLLAQ